MPAFLRSVARTTLPHENCRITVMQANSRHVIDSAYIFVDKHNRIRITIRNSHVDTSFSNNGVAARDAER
jgi:hypothetical protein